jgi:hypothetical protein
MNVLEFLTIEKGAGGDTGHGSRRGRCPHQPQDKILERVSLTLQFLLFYLAQLLIKVF